MFILEAIFFFLGGGGGYPRPQAAISCKEVAILVEKSKQTIKTGTAL